MAPFRKDRSQVIARAQKAGVNTIVSVGIDLASSEQAIKLAQSFTGVWATVGFHPHNVAGISGLDVARLAQIAAHPRVVAIGEAGLDFYRDYSPREAQLRALKWQLELAAEMGLPVVIHCRRAEEDLLPLLRDWTSRGKIKPVGVIHCFSGDTTIAQQYLEMGFFISLGAYIGYPSSNKLRSVITNLPADRLLVETDSPYLPPQSHRGKRNEPAYLVETVALLAEIRGVSPEQIASETTRNANYLFRLPLATDKD